MWRIHQSGKRDSKKFQRKMGSQGMFRLGRRTTIGKSKEQICNKFFKLL